MNIEQKLGKILVEMRLGITTAEKINLIQALLSSPDIAVVEKTLSNDEIRDKLFAVIYGECGEHEYTQTLALLERLEKVEKMQRVVEATKEYHAVMHEAIKPICEALAGLKE